MAATGRSRIAAATIAVLFAVAVCEVAARAIFPAPPNPARQPQIKYRFDPEIRYLPLPNQHGWIDDGFVTTNSAGFRGADPATPKPAGRFRIVAIGDSVTFGFGVNDGDTFCAQAEGLLRAKLSSSDLDLVNLAVPGYDTRQEVVLLGRHVARLHPDLVLVGLYSNDIPDSLEDSQSGTTVAVSAATPDKILEMNAAPTSWWDLELRKSRAVYVVGRALHRAARSGEWGMQRFSLELDMLEDRTSPPLEKAWSRVAAQLGQLRTLADANKFQVGIIVLPPREQVVGRYPQAQYQTRVSAIAADLGFFVVDPLPALSSSHIRPEDLYIAYDRNHPSKAGHRIIAEALASELVRRGYLNAERRLAATDVR